MTSVCKSGFVTNTQILKCPISFKIYCLLYSIQDQRIQGILNYWRIHEIETFKKIRKDFELYICKFRIVCLAMNKVNKCKKRFHQQYSGSQVSLANQKQYQTCIQFIVTQCNFQSNFLGIDSRRLRKKSTLSQYEKLSIKYNIF